MNPADYNHHAAHPSNSQDAPRQTLEIGWEITFAIMYYTLRAVVAIYDYCRQTDAITWSVILWTLACAGVALVGAISLLTANM